MRYTFASLVILTVTLTMTLGGCGNIQIPSGAPPRDINTPPAQRAQNVQASSSGSVQRRGVSSAAFVGASAVTVGKGDTVYALSRRHKVPVPAIIRANGLKPPYLLNVGQRIELPRGAQHRVAPGDTLYSVAQRYDVVMYELARLNDIGAPYTIRVGETLVIPEDARTAPRVQTASVRKPKTVSPPVKKAEPAPQPAPAKPARQMERAPKTGGEVAVVPPRKPPAPVPPPAARTGSGFVWPLRGPLMSNFGNKDGGLRNDGINIIAPEGTPVVAAENGVVAYAGNEIRGFGNLLLIKHADGYVTAYAHNRDLLVKRGQRVKRGQKIATVGQTGSVGRPQLHFEIRKGRRPRNPEKYLRDA